MEELVAENLIDVIDWTKLENISQDDLTTDMVTYLEALEEDGFDILKYSVPYFWGSIGLLYNHNIAGLEQRVQNEEWSILADQNLKTMLYDSSRDAFMIGLAHNNKKLSTATQSDITQAKEWLISTKGRNTSIKSDQILDEALGDNTPYDVAVVYSGDATYILQENENYSFYNPSFTNVWIDGMTISKNSQNKDLAYQFIDFISNFDNHLENTFYLGYTAVRQDVLEAILEDEDYEEDRIVYAYTVSGIMEYEFFRFEPQLFAWISEAWIDVKAN